MDSYKVIVPTSVWQRIDRNITYIKEHYGFSETAQSVYERIEEAICSLSDNPNRGAPRRVGKYANKGYRQIFVGNYIIVYRVNSNDNQVLIETVRHMLEDF